MKKLSFSPFSVALKSLTLLLLILLGSRSLMAQNACEANFTTAINQSAKTVAFTNTSFGANVHFIWNFGDGTSSTLTSPTHTFGSGLTYTVCLTVIKNDSSCTHTRCSTMVFTNPCNAAWTLSTDSLNKLKKYFAATNTDTNYYYKWTFGDGGISDNRTPHHIYLHDGRYRVCLRVTKKDSSCTNEICDSITVSPNTNSNPCVSSWSFTTDATNALKKFYTANTSGTGYSYVWSFGDGTSSTSVSNHSDHIYPHSGKFRVCLTIALAGTNCTSTTCDSITVGSNVPTPCVSTWTLTTDPSNPLKKNFASTSTSNDFRYLWTFGDGITSDSKTPVHIYPHGGKYKVCLKVTKFDSSCTSTTCDSITVTAPTTNACEARFTYVKTNREVHFTNTSTGTYTRSVWSFGDNTHSDLSNPVHTYSANGTYTACLHIYRIVGNDTLCRAEKCSTIVVTSSTYTCIASFTYSVNQVLRSVDFHNISTGQFLTYRWTFGDDSISTDLTPPTHFYLHNGTYRVCLRIINSLDTNCRSEYCTFVYIHSPDSNGTQSNVTAGFSYSVPNPENNTVQFSSSSTGSALALSWDFGDGEFSNDENPVHSFLTKDWHLVCLRASSGNYTDETCNNIWPDINAPSGMSNPDILKISKIYPNPFFDQIKLELVLRNAAPVTIRLMDISGKIIEEKVLNLQTGNNQIEFETAHLDKGFYLMNIQGSGINKSMKLIK